MEEREEVNREALVITILFFVFLLIVVAVFLLLNITALMQPLSVSS